MFRQILKAAVPLVAVLFFALGVTLEQILLPVTAQARGASPSLIGLIGTAHFTGIFCGSLATRTLMTRLGDRRSFVLAAGIATATLFSYTTVREPAIWPLLTCVTGFAYALLVIGSESWVSSAALPQYRAGLLAVYMLLYDATDVLAASLASLVGPMGGGLFGGGLFALASILLACAGILIIVSRRMSRGPVQEAVTDPLRLRDLWRLSPVAVLGAIVCGTADSAYLALAPVYSITLGASPQQATAMLAMASIFAAVAQYPLSRWSDHAGRTAPIVWTSLASALFILAVALGPRSHGIILIGLFALYAGAVSPIYGLIGAGAYDRAPASSFAGVAAGLLLCYSLGGIVGPVSLGLAMDHGPAGTAFALLALIHLLPVAMIIARCLPDRQWRPQALFPAFRPRLPPRRLVRGSGD